VDRLKRWSKRSWHLKSGASPGFHLRSFHPFLEKYIKTFEAGMAEDERGASVLVPLCGKSADMTYLCDQGCRVVGVEGVQRPIIEFKSEQRMRLKEFKHPTMLTMEDGEWKEGTSFQPAETFQGAKPGWVFKKGDRGLGYYTDGPRVWKGKANCGNNRKAPLQVLQMDMFDVTSDLIKVATYEDRGYFDMIYDRGGLESIPPEARAEYIEKTTQLLKQGGRMLLIVLDYNQDKVPIDPKGKRSAPPPYSLPEEEVRKLFPSSDWDVRLVDKQAEITGLSAGNPFFSDVDVKEVCYILTKKSASGSVSGSATGRILAALFGGAGAVAAIAFGCYR